MAESENITKQDAVRRQIEAAIVQFMANGDLLSVNTLTMASINLLYELYKSKNVPVPYLEIIKPDKRQEVIFIMNKTYNFSKHAKNDPDETERFYFGAVEGHLFEAIDLYGSFFKMKTKTMDAYSFWFALKHPDLLIEGKAKEQYRKGAELFDLTNKAQFFSDYMELA